MSNSERIAQLVRDLYVVVAELEEIAPGRLFTPDGHLVGTQPPVLAITRYHPMARDVTWWSGPHLGGHSGMPDISRRWVRNIASAGG